MGFFCHILFHSRDSVFCLVVIVLLKFQTLENLVAGHRKPRVLCAQGQGCFLDYSFYSNNDKAAAILPPLRACLLCVLSVIMPAWIVVLVLFTLSLTNNFCTAFLRGYKPTKACFCKFWIEIMTASTLFQNAFHDKSTATLILNNSNEGT